MEVHHGVRSRRRAAFVRSPPSSPPLQRARRTPAAADTVQPGTFPGYGFDACTAPSSATMQAWLASPYRAVGIYFGGNNRGCTQPNLTAGWVAHQQAAGWHLIPIYLGPAGVLHHVQQDDT